MQALKRETLAQVFSCEFNKMFKNTFLADHLRATAFDSLTLKRRKSYQNKNNRTVTYSFGSRPLIFKLQQEISKLNDTSVSFSI